MVCSLGKRVVVPVGYQDEDGENAIAGLLVVLVLVGIQDKEGGVAADVLHIEVVPVEVQDEEDDVDTDVLHVEGVPVRVQDKQGEDAVDCLLVVVVSAVNHHLHLHPHHQQGVWVGILQEVVSATLEQGSGLNPQLLCGCSTRTEERVVEDSFLFTSLTSSHSSFLPEPAFSCQPPSCLMLPCAWLLLIHTDD